MNNSIFAGDFHLGKNTNLGKTSIGNTLNSREVDQFNILDWILDQCVENHADHLFLKGDIFEEPKPNINLVSTFLGWLKKCSDFGITVHIIIGNHDVLRVENTYISPLDIVEQSEIENIHVYKNIDTIFIDNIAYTLLPFRDRKSLNCSSNKEAVDQIAGMLDYELALIPKHYKKVLLGHLALEGSLFVGDEVDDMDNELFLPIEIAKKYDYSWFGHVHAPQVLNKSPYVAHIGSIDISNFGESKHDKILVLFNDNGFSEIKIPNRKYNNISIVIPKEITDTTEYVLNALKGFEIKNNIVKLEVNLEDGSSVALDKSKIEKELKDSGVFNLSSFTQTKQTKAVKKNSSVDTKIEFSDAIKKWSESEIEADEKEDFISACNDILNIFKLGNKE